MKNTKLLYLLGSLIALSSCDKNNDLSDKADSIYSVAENGVKPVLSYDIDEKYKSELWIQKGGLGKNNSQVVFRVEPTILDSLNKEDGTAYQLLPEDCYELTIPGISFSDSERLLAAEVTYDPTKIASLSGYNTVRYVLPLQAKAIDGRLNPDRDRIILAFEVAQPIVTIANGGFQQVDINSIKRLPVEITVPFTNKWNISCQLKNDQFVVDEYNATNNTFFALLPNDQYSAPEKIELKEGENSSIVNYELSDGLLPGNYLLPVQIDNITATLGGNPTDVLVPDTKTSVIYSLIKEGTKVDKTDWNILSVTSEEPTGEGAGNGKAIHMIDGNTETFWHSKWSGGNTPLPYEIVIDMKKNVHVAQIELLPRGRGSNNPLKLVRFEGSMDNSNWEQLGSFEFINQDQPLIYAVKSTKCRYIKLVIPDDGGNQRVAAIRELDVRGVVL
ncbi:MAG: BT_3987 domain-containing protein [Bacteroidales bacterium]